MVYKPSVRKPKSTRPTGSPNADGASTAWTESVALGMGLDFFHPLLIFDSSEGNHDKYIAHRESDES